MSVRHTMLGLILPVLVIVGLSGCGGGSSSAPVTIRSASLSGAQENPPVTSAATGRGAVFVNPNTKEITGGMTFSGVTPSTGGHHIHQAPSGNPTANGPVIVGMTLAPDSKSATVPASTTLTDAQYAAFLAGELYFNVHSAANPTGEIRGRINIDGGVTAASAPLNGTQEVPPNASSATGRGTLLFDTNTREVLAAYITHNVANTTVAHIHTGAAGVSGPANVMTFLAGTNVWVGPTPSTLTAQHVTDLSAGNLYFNVHSPAPYVAGEIRGQLAVQ